MKHFVRSSALASCVFLSVFLAAGCGGNPDYDQVEVSFESGEMAEYKTALIAAIEELQAANESDGVDGFLAAVKGATEKINAAYPRNAGQAAQNEAVNQLTKIEDLVDVAPEHNKGSLGSELSAIAEEYKQL